MFAIQYVAAVPVGTCRMFFLPFTYNSPVATRSDFTNKLAHVFIHLRLICCHLKECVVGEVPDLLEDGGCTVLSWSSGKDWIISFVVGVISAA